MNQLDPIKKVYDMYSEEGKPVLEGWRAAIAVGTNDGPLTNVSNS